MMMHHLADVQSRATWGGGDAARKVVGEEFLIFTKSIAISLTLTLRRLTVFASLDDFTA